MRYEISKSLIIAPFFLLAVLIIAEPALAANPAKSPPSSVDLPDQANQDPKGIDMSEEKKGQGRKVSAEEAKAMTVDEVKNYFMAKYKLTINNIGELEKDGDYLVSMIMGKNAGFLPHGVGKGRTLTPTEIANMFIEEEKVFFGIDSLAEDLTKPKVSTVEMDVPFKGSTIVRYRRTVSAIPILWDLSVGITKGGEIYFIGFLQAKNFNTIKANIESELSSVTIRTEEQIYDIVYSNIIEFADPEIIELIEKGELTVEIYNIKKFPTYSDAPPFFSIHVGSTLIHPDPNVTFFSEDWDYEINPLNGEILNKFSSIIYDWEY